MRKTGNYMKKLVCLLLAALMLSAGTALADVSAVYSNGKVTVFTDEEGYWEITIDTEWAGRWVGTGMPRNTFSMRLEDGEHQAFIYDQNSGRMLSASFWVGDAPTPAPTFQPVVTAVPEGPVRLTGVTYAKGALTFQVSGLRGYAEVWLDGENTGLLLKENGEQRLLILLDEGDHSLDLYAPACDEIDSTVFFRRRLRPQRGRPAGSDGRAGAG